jgi:hypothetical protein
MVKCQKEITSNLTNMLYYVGKIEELVKQEVPEADTYEDIESIKALCRTMRELSASVSMCLT